jgi:choline dehydrogenase-like flavoprotein
MLSHLGMHPEHLIPRNICMKTAIPIAGCAHQAGTCRFAQIQRPQCWTLTARRMSSTISYVVDTSFFVSIGAVNPSLTAIANAIRAGAITYCRGWRKRLAALMTGLRQRGFL